MLKFKTEVKCAKMASMQSVRDSGPHSRHQEAAVGTVDSYTRLKSEIFEQEE